MTKPESTPEPSRTGLATVAEAMDFLKMGRSSIYELMDRGELESIRILSSRRILWSSIYAFIERNRSGEPPANGAGPT
jgi:hypothetical protein